MLDQLEKWLKDTDMLLTEDQGKYTIERLTHHAVGGSTLIEAIEAAIKIIGGTDAVTVEALKEILEELIQLGHGKDQVRAWDPEEEHWQVITGYVVGKQTVDFYTDDIY